MELKLSKDNMIDNEYVVTSRNERNQYLFIMNVARVEYIQEINQLFVYDSKDRKMQSIDLNETTKLNIDPDCCILGLEALKTYAEVIS